MDPGRTVVVLGAEAPSDLPGIDRIRDQADLVFATRVDDLVRVLPSAEILLGWDFRADHLKAAWHAAERLRWIHWCGAGVDAVLFPKLCRSGVTLTNARGVFDRAMSEYVLGLILAQSKLFPETFAMQTARTWRHRVTETIENRLALVVGVGSIGRSIARLLAGVGMRVEGVGRSQRSDDPDFERIHTVADLDTVLPRADFVIAVVPLTAETRGLFSRRRFAAMKPTARFINLGRGALVDESALVEALQTGEIGGAALDVFETEPLPADSPLWSTENLIISPHMSGDFVGYESVLVDLFADNLRRYREGLPLRNVVDVNAGFVTSGGSDR